MVRWLFTVLVLGLAGCAVQPTKMVDGENFSAHRVQWPQVFQAQWNPSENFLLLDVRPTFEVTMTRLQRSQTLRLEDYPLPDLRSPEFEAELGTLARRLALKGIEPKRKTWIVGTGLQGDAEEFYFVWLLKMMGVENVAAVSFSQIKWPVTTLQESAVHNALPWTPGWDTAVVELSTGRNAPYRGFRAQTDLLIWAQNKPADALKPNQLKAFKNSKQVLWNSLYDENLKTLSSHIKEEFKDAKQGSIWISGARLPEIFAVFLALSSEGYSNVKIVLPEDIKPWL